MVGLGLESLFQPDRGDSMSSAAVLGFSRTWSSCLQSSTAFSWAGCESTDDLLDGFPVLTDKSSGVCPAPC